MNAASPEGSVGWGIAGCGWVTRDYVAPALAQSQTNKAVALLDLDASALSSVGRLLPGAALNKNLDSFLATPGLDAVYVATPHDAHVPVIVAAAAAGKHVLCEKPIATTVEAAERAVGACEEAGVFYATALDQRFHTAHRRLRKLVADGVLGTITMARIHYACWLPPHWEPETATEPHDNWRVDPARAGGAFADLAPHGLDLLQTLLGEEIVEVSCLFQRRVFDYPVEDGAALVASFSGGALATISNAFNCPDAFPRRTLELYGTQAAAVARNTMGQTPGGTLEIISAADGKHEAVEIPPEEDVSPFLAQIEAFGEALTEGRPYPFLPEKDLHTMRLLEAALRGGGTRVEPAGRASGRTTPGRVP